MQLIKVSLSFGVSAFGLMGMAVGLLGAQFAVSLPPAQASALTIAPLTALAAHSAIARSLDDYQPPDVGGPGQTQGTGTR